MKKLILSLILIPFLASAGNEMQISDSAIQSKFLTVVKDVEVENMLGKTAEFNDCRKMNTFEATDTKPMRDQKLKDATACFVKKMPKDAKKLQEFSASLQLENYGLVKSKNVGEITNYLASKMHKSLTGQNPEDENNSESLKWKNRKIVDQKVFIDMYTNQLMKTALLEVSRFCFENLEKTAIDKKGSNFASYWQESDFVINKDASGKESIPSTIGDQSTSSFFNIPTATDMTKKDDVMIELQKGIATSDAKPALYQKFLTFCQSSIKLLCSDFRQNATSTAMAEAKANQTNTSTSMSRGANACLTMDKLQNIRTTMARTEMVAKQFEEMGEKKGDFALQMLENPQMYQRGKGANEESLDELTSYASADMLPDGGDDDLEKLRTKCSQDASTDDCKEFLLVNDSLDKAINNVESEMNLKREIEKATVKEMLNKPEELEKYLSDNGHFDLLNKLKDKSLAPQDIETELGKIYDARKVAEIETLKLKVGKRQINEDDDKLLVGQKRNDQIADNIKDTKEERARFAQVVMFNNIITSQLDLKDTSGNSVGRNVTGLNKEFTGMGNAYDNQLFEQVKSDAKDNTSTRDDISISGGGIIDSILGKAP